MPIISGDLKLVMVLVTMLIPLPLTSDYTQLIPTNAVLGEEYMNKQMMMRRKSLWDDFWDKGLSG